MSSRLLITGGAGFIGSHVAEAASAAGYEVAALDNLSTGKQENLPPGVRLYEVDLRDAQATQGVLADFKPDCVSHQAAQASVSVSVKQPALDVAVNVLGGVHLLDACVRHRVQHFVFASTGGAIYGEVAEGSRASEGHSTAPVSPYAISKLAFEQLLGAYRRYYDLSSTTLRYANVYGPRQDPFGEAGVVAIFCERLAQSKPLRINARKAAGDSGCVRDYVYVGDVARMNLLALAGELPEQLINVGTGTGTTTRELALVLGQIAGKEPALESSEPRAGDLERSVLDPAQCERALGEMTALEKGLSHTWSWSLGSRG